MRTGLALTAYETKLRLDSAKWHILDEIGKPTSMTDAYATQLCAVLSHVDSALKILQQQTPDDRPPLDLSSGAGDE